jgi:alpha,alpha-trehalase
MVHIEDFSPIYEQIQSAGYYEDSKFFVDCTPIASNHTILTAYKNAIKSTSFDLAAFVKQYFEAPKIYDADYQTGEKTIDEHLETLWQVLRRSPDKTANTLIDLPYPYIVPGGRFREIYYWDSYFTMLGLAESGHIDMIENMVKNFAYLIEHYGFIPNGNRSYYLSRSQPPFFTCMVKLLAELKGEDILAQYIPHIKKEYAFWVKGYEKLNAQNTESERVVLTENNSFLNRFWDNRPEPRPEAYREDVHTQSESEQNTTDFYRHIRAAAESGWDFSSRWFDDPQRLSSIRTTSLLPVCLNSLLYDVEKTLADFYAKKNEKTEEECWRIAAERRHKDISSYFWNKNLNIFTDFDLHSKQQRNIATLATLYPLFFNIATASQAASVADFVAKNFLKDGGVVTTLAQTAQQWDAPNGWAPLQWITYQGLKNYGFTTLANEVSRRWIALNEKTFAETGKMMEKYNVEDLSITAGGGEYPNQDGFGWTNGVYIKLKKFRN